MDYEIRPDPSEEERAAILAALAGEDEQPAPSPWAQAALPERESSAEEQP